MLVNTVMKITTMNTDNGMLFLCKASDMEAANTLKIVYVLAKSFEVYFLLLTFRNNNRTAKTREEKKKKNKKEKWRHLRARSSTIFTAI